MNKTLFSSFLKLTYLIVLCLYTKVSYGQTIIKTIEKQIRYTDGLEIFNICLQNCVTKFDDKKEYYWYTSFSNIKSTKGGSGGDLLHGNYKFYDKNGKLLQDKNYYLGLPNGSEKNWDSLGNITSHIRYNKGEIVYWKFQNEEKYWIEFNGPMFKVGTIRKVYTNYNVLISEDINLPNLRKQIKTFYEYSGKLKESYTTLGFDVDNLIGKYTSYFENGKIEVDGQYYDGDYPNIQIGTWKWYKSDGTLKATEIYKAEFEKWVNGDIKVAGGYIFDSVNNTWIKIGVWRWYSEEGKFLSRKNYNWGVEITE